MALLKKVEVVARACSQGVLNGEKLFFQGWGTARSASPRKLEKGSTGGQPPKLIVSAI